MRIKTGYVSSNASVSRLEVRVPHPNSCFFLLSPCLHCILFVSDVVYPLLCLVTHILNFLHTAANNISILAGKQGCSRKVFALLKIVLVITVLFRIWSKMFSSKNISNAMLFCCCAFTLAMDHVSNVPWSNAFLPIYVAGWSWHRVDIVCFACHSMGPIYVNPGELAL